MCSAGTPGEIVDKLNKEMNAGLADPALHAKLLAVGIEPKAMTQAEFAKFVGDEIQKWSKVITFADIKAE